MRAVSSQVRGRELGHGRCPHLSEGSRNARVAPKSKKPARKLLGKEAGKGANDEWSLMNRRCGRIISTNGPSSGLRKWD